MDDNMNIIHGVNFASADYLGLAKNDFARDAAIEAATNFGVNSAGSPLAFGATKYFKFISKVLYAIEVRTCRVLGSQVIAHLFSWMACWFWCYQGSYQRG